MYSNNVCKKNDDVFILYVFIIILPSYMTYYYSVCSFVCILHMICTRFHNSRAAAGESLLLKIIGIYYYY